MSKIAIIGVCGVGRAAMVEAVKEIDPNIEVVEISREQHFKTLAPEPFILEEPRTFHKGTGLTYYPQKGSKYHK